MSFWVRNPSQIIGSIESLIQRSPDEPSGIIGPELGIPIYGRVRGLIGANGMVGFTLSALQEAVYAARSIKLMLLRNESLIANPLADLKKVSALLGEEMGDQDPHSIEPRYDTIEFNRRLGTLGLHDVGRRVMARVRPPDLSSTMPPAVSGNVRSSSRAYCVSSDSLPRPKLGPHADRTACGIVAPHVGARTRR